MWGGETYCKKGRPAQSAVFLYKKGKVWVTRWSTLFPFYKGKQLIFLSEGARRQSYSAAVERFLSPHISSKDLASTNVSGGCFNMTGNSAARRQFQVMPKCPQDNSNHTQFYFKS